MVGALNLLENFGNLLCNVNVADDGRKEVLKEVEDEAYGVSGFSKLRMTRKGCLRILSYLCEAFFIPDFYDEYSIKCFCLENACLLFCTASSSAKLHLQGSTPVELLVVNEAAQLKECESAIPLQVCGLCHALLMGMSGSFLHWSKARFLRRLNLEEVYLRGWHCSDTESIFSIPSVGCIHQ